MKVFILILMVFSLTGCWNYNELTDIAIVTGVAIDKVDDKFMTTLMIANSKKEGEGGDSPAIVVYEGFGETIYEALKDSALSISKTLYFGHLEVLLLSEDIASEDTSLAVDFLFRYPQTRNDFYVAIALDSLAGDIFKITLPIDSFPSQGIVNNLMITDKLLATSHAVDFNDFIKILVNDGVNAVLPTVYIVGDVEEGNSEDNLSTNMPSTYLRLDTLALFFEDKLVAIANDDESKGINIINNNVSVMSLGTDYLDGRIVCEIIRSNSSFKVIKNQVFIDVKMAGAIEELTVDMDLTNNDNIVKLEEAFSNQILDYINDAIKLCLENDTDVFGFLEYLYRYDYKYYNEIKDKWYEQYFDELEVVVDIDIELETKGNTNNIMEVIS